MHGDEYTRQKHFVMNFDSAWNLLENLVTCYAIGQFRLRNETLF